MAQVETLFVKDANGTTREVPTLLPVVNALTALIGATDGLEALATALNNYANDLPVGITAVTVGTDYTPGKYMLINCTVGGNVVLKYSNDSTFTFAVNPGMSRIWGAFKGVVSATATATYGIEN